MSRLLAFGGPLNEQMVDVDDNAPIVFAALPAKASLVEQADVPTTTSFRQITYRIETVGVHDARKCGPLPNDHEACRWTARCLVADGFPTHRITDPLNALLGLMRWFPGVSHGE